ncbi:MAG: hypothetical protein LBT70_00150, partial [Holosporaceae bacterium]|nr:hypothetical protein [Holosporaceae bacterium]
IRQYLPKNHDFKDVGDKRIREIEKRLNNRPRKVLKYKTPDEIIHGHDSFAIGTCGNVALHV